MLKLFKSALVALLGLGMSSVIAQTDPRFGAFMQTVAGNSTTVKFGGGGVPVATSAAPLGTPSVQAMGFTRTAEGVFMESNGFARVPGTTSTVPISTKLKLSSAVIGKTLARAALAYSAWEAGSALYDIWADAGLSLNSQGQVVDPSVSTFPQSTGYQVSVDWIGWTPRTFKTLADYCAGYDAYRDYYYGSGSVSSCSGGGSGPWTVAGYWSGNYLPRTDYPSVSSCPAGWYITPDGCVQTAPSVSLTEQQIADRIAQQSGWPDSTITGAMADALKLPGIQPVIAPDIEAQPETQTQVQIQGAPNGATIGDPVTTETTTTNPDGTTSTTTKTTTTTVTRDGNKLVKTQDTVTTVTVKDAQGNPISTTTTTTTTPQTPTTAAEGEDLECGLPDTPACRIDETGTPETVPELEDPQQQADDVYKPLADILEDPESFWPELPEFNWSFQLPTGCGILNVPAFEPFLTGIDVCQFQPMFHDIMTVVWVMGGLFGAIGLFWRNTMATQ